MSIKPWVFNKREGTLSAVGDAVVYTITHPNKKNYTLTVRNFNTGEIVGRIERFENLYDAEERALRLEERYGSNTKKPIMWGLVFLVCVVFAILDALTR